MCSHETFAAEVDVNRLVDSGRFMADVRIRCSTCGERFVFIGLPLGVDLNKPMMSIYGHEARLPIRPASEPVPTGWTGATGWTTATDWTGTTIDY